METDATKSSADVPLTGLTGQGVLPGCEDNFHGADSVAVDLTAQEERFCREYIIDRNGTKAYLRAYPHCTYNTSRTESAKLLAKPCIINRINELEEARNARLDVTGDRVLQQLAILAFSDPRDLFDGDGALIPLHELDHDTATSIHTFETVGRKGGMITKVKLHDRRAALELLGRSTRLSLFKESMDLTHTHRFSELSDAELLELAKQKAAEVLNAA